MRVPVLAFAVLAIVVGGLQPAAAQSVAPDERSAAPRTPWGDPDSAGAVEPRDHHAARTARGIRRSRTVDRRGNRGRQPRIRDARDLGAAERADPRAGRRPRLQPVLVGSRHLDRPHVARHRSGGRPAAAADVCAAEVRGDGGRRSGWPLPSGGGVPAHGPEDMDLGDRCLVYRHVPITSSGYNNHVHVLQSPGYVAIFQEQIHDFRIIPVTEQPELPDQVRQWLGVSRGHWEGDTLVVETKSFHAQTDYLGSGPEPPRRRALHPAGRGRHRVFLHGDRSERLDAAVERDGALASRRRADVRVRLSRGELRHDQSPHVVAGGGSRPLRSTKTIVEAKARRFDMRVRGFAVACMLVALTAGAFRAGRGTGGVRAAAPR